MNTNLNWQTKLGTRRSPIISATPNTQDKVRSRKLIAAASKVFQPKTIVFARNTKRQDLRDLAAQAHKTMDLTKTDHKNLNDIFMVLGNRITSVEEARQMLIGATAAILENYPKRKLPSTFTANSGFRITGHNEIHKFSYPTIDPDHSPHWQLGRQAMYILTHHSQDARKPAAKINIRTPVPILPRPTHATQCVD